MSFSTEEDYRDGFGPFTPGFRILPYGDADAVDAAMHPNVAAVLVEPIQGEAGIVVPPEGYLRRLREITKEHNALLICDEIQSGLGRTGKMFCYEHEGIRPDMVIVGKALSGGFYPVSGILADDPVMVVFKPGEHGSTYGGNPMAAAVGRAALRVLVEEGMVENSAALGPYFMERLQDDPLAAHQGDPRQGPVDRHRAAPRGRRRPPLLRGAPEGRAPLQGDPRPRHPHRPAAGHQEGRDRLGDGAAGEGADDADSLHRSGRGRAPLNGRPFPCSEGVSGLE